MKRENNVNGKLPSGYTRLQYIESTGTQYCAIPWNIGRTITSVEVRTDVYPVQNSITYGGFIGTNVSSSFEIYYTRNNGGRFAFYIDTNTTIYNDGYTYNQWYQVTANVKDGIKTLGIDGVYVQGTHSGTIRYSPSYLTICRYSSTECYQGKIKETYIKIVATGGTLEVNLIPALRNSDSKPGLYDTVNGVFYTNQGTGEFLYE